VASRDARIKDTPSESDTSIEARNRAWTRLGLTMKQKRLKKDAGVSTVRQICRYSKVTCTGVSMKSSSLSERIAWVAPTLIGSILLRPFSYS
jgi:hypothetical protein